jgi:lipid A 3-O-deacylase
MALCALPQVARGAQEGGPPAAPAATADEADRGPRHAVSFRWENDVVGGTDRNYSNGLSLVASLRGRGPLGWIWRAVGAADSQLVSGYEVSQMINTPKDIRSPNPDPNDMPYSGILYGGVSTLWAHGDRLEGFKLVAGVVGPASGAERTQRAFHRLIGSPEPMGWSHQLENQFILNMVAEHRRRFTIVGSPSGWQGQAIPLVGGTAGNGLVQAQAQARFRVGYHLPDDFGTTQLRGLGNQPFPGSRHGNARFGVHGFAGIGGTAVARNLALDGNSSGNGPHVKKKACFPSAEAGFSIWVARVTLTFAYVFWGREFETQERPVRFGAATVTVRM